MEENIPEFQQVKETTPTDQPTVQPTSPNQPGIKSTWPPALQPETPKPKVSLWVYVLSILIVILLGLVGYFGYQLYSQPTEPTPIETSSPTPTSDPTADWETYQRGYSYSLKYPSTWKVTSDDAAGLKLQPTSSLNQYEPAITIAIRYNPENKTMLQLDEEAKKAEIYYGTYNPNQATINISDETAFYQKDTRCDPFTCDGYVLLHDKKIYYIHNVFSPTASEIEKEQQRQEFAQIFSTFKLLDEMANWKTYTNNELGFQFEYPPDWELKLRSETESLLQMTLIKEDSTQGDAQFFNGETSEKITPTYFIQVLVKDNPQNLSSKDYFLRNDASVPEDELAVVKVNGKNAVKTNGQPGNTSFPAAIIYVVSKGRVYIINYGARAHESTNLKYFNVFEEVLSTFKFTD